MSKSLVTLEPSELSDDEQAVTEVTLSIERGNDRDEEITMSPAELTEVYARMKLYFEQGIWSQKTVEWS